MSELNGRRRFLASGLVLGAGAMLAQAARAMVGGERSSLDTVLAMRWDHIIVGGGSAGCVLARRLSEDAGTRVLLLEAGHEADDPAVYHPPAWPGLAGGEFDWNYRSTPQGGLGNRVVGEPRGKGLGGSSLINALGFQRGPQGAYERWAVETGDPGWGFKGLLPYFRRLETASSGTDAYRGGDGPLRVLEIGDVRDQNPLSAAFAAAGVEAGHRSNLDWNGASAEGTIWTQLTMDRGRRDTAASAYLSPVRGWPNLGIVTGAQVLRLRIERSRCVGMDVLSGGNTRTLSATREIILSAGAFDSPRLLMLSGIGPAEALRRVGIACAHDLPGVGRELHDHPLVPGLLYRAKRPIPPSHYNHCETMVLARSSRSPGWADLQLMFLTVPFLSPELGAAPAGTFSIVPALLLPRSRGTLQLSSADPLAPALIDPAYLSDPQDVELLVEALEMSRRIASSPALRDWVGDEVFPGRNVTSRAALAAHIRRTASPFYHPVSTCRMGRPDDRLAVVDPACRVRGVAGLRIVDASIFPSVPQAMTQAAVLAVAERASDLIRHRG